MGNTSKKSPFAVAHGSYSDDHSVVGLRQPNRQRLRQWRNPPVSFLHPPENQPHDSDPYLLVLLADQELEARRTEQAASLIEAAYAAYDQSGFGS